MKETVPHHKKGPREKLKLTDSSERTQGGCENDDHPMFVLSI